MDRSVCVLQSCPEGLTIIIDHATMDDLSLLADTVDAPHVLLLAAHELEAPRLRPAPLINTSSCVQTA